MSCSDNTPVFMLNCNDSREALAASSELIFSSMGDGFEARIQLYVLH